ncbi:MAG: hypothetical protein ACR2HD_10545, partial [Solirubrobacteraceae bacterium]
RITQGGQIGVVQPEIIDPSRAARADGAAGGGGEPAKGEGCVRGPGGVVFCGRRSAIVSRCARGIDDLGLHNTNLAALRDALARVACPGCICLSDGFAVGETGFEQHAVIDGDARSAAIAAASILAKVTRDRYMRRADELHPGWEFGAHVGYATPEHRAAIERNGVSPLHRLSFRSAAYQQLAL